MAEDDSVEPTPPPTLATIPVEYDDPESDGGPDYVYGPIQDLPDRAPKYAKGQGLLHVNRTIRAEYKDELMKRAHIAFTVDAKNCNRTSLWRLPEYLTAKIRKCSVTVQFVILRSSPFSVAKTALEDLVKRVDSCVDSLASVLYRELKFELFARDPAKPVTAKRLSTQIGKYLHIAADLFDRCVRRLRYSRTLQALHIAVQTRDSNEHYWGVLRGDVWNEPARMVYGGPWDWTHYYNRITGEYELENGEGTNQQQEELPHRIVWTKDPKKILNRGWHEVSANKRLA